MIPWSLKHKLTIGYSQIKILTKNKHHQSCIISNLWTKLPLSYCLARINARVLRPFGQWVFGHQPVRRNFMEFDKIQIFGLVVLLQLQLFYHRNPAVKKFQSPRVSSGNELLAKLRDCQHLRLVLNCDYDPPTQTHPLINAYLMWLLVV